MPRRKKIPNQESSMYGRDHVVWTNEMDNVLINAILEEDHKGNRPEGTWNTRVFDNMLQVLRVAFGPVIQKSNIKNRMKTLKRTFAECKDLFHGLSGFAWNPVTKLFEATFDVWEINSGEYAESAREKVRRWQREGSSSQIDLNDTFENVIMSDSEFNWVNEVTDNNMNSPEPSLHSQGTSSRCSKRKVSMMEMLEKQYERLKVELKGCQKSWKEEMLLQKNGSARSKPGPAGVGEALREWGNILVVFYRLWMLDLRTDDDLPPSHQSRIPRGGRVAGNGRPVAPSMPYPRMYVETDMETQIHQLEQEAYSSVLRAFKAQADAITWEKESLITELRKELRLSNEEHRELLGRVNADDVIRRIREWRQTGGLQSGILGTGQAVHDPIPSPTVSASRKKQKITSSQSLVGLPSASSMKSIPHLSSGQSGRGQVANRVSSGAAPEGATSESLIGKKVRTRWPDDNNFYEAVITDYNPVEGRHALVYDIGSANETWEWVNLSEISPEDIQWEGEDPGIPHRGGYGGSGHAMNRSVGRDSIPGVGRGRGVTKGQSRKDLLPSQNGIGKKLPDDIQILHTDTLIKEVSERVFGANHPDPLEIEKAKKVLKDHEQSLLMQFQGLRIFQMVKVVLIILSCIILPNLPGPMATNFKIA
ncbi:hypothetical protein GH714_003933 [Hevea brasiliensis]|uniref:ENT domain-containing protein n=1 Tax=Hevea brasiliensis TaxID=3981 RepID=A0A6A6L0F1_HEVBR|nr:hypothetical protein GH714_003933 [Hevea brasiliensis]